MHLFFKIQVVYESISDDISDAEENYPSDKGTELYDRQRSDEPLLGAVGVEERTEGMAIFPHMSVYSERFFFCTQRLCFCLMLTGSLSYWEKAYHLDLEAHSCSLCAVLNCLSYSR